MGWSAAEESSIREAYAGARQAGKTHDEAMQAATIRAVELDREKLASPIQAKVSGTTCDICATVTDKVLVICDSCQENETASGLVSCHADASRGTDISAEDWRGLLEQYGTLHLYSDNGRDLFLKDLFKAASEQGARLATLGTQLEAAQHEVAKMDAVLRVTAPELIARLTSSCAWCGEEPAPVLEPEELKRVIREHVKVCRQHPMRELEARVADLMKEGEDWEAAANMYARAWQRELGGSLAPKRHFIDALVLTTRQLREDRDTWARLAVEMEREANGWRALALRQLVLGLMVRAQWERYVTATEEANTLGCPGQKTCHGAMVWCPVHGDVRLLCDAEGRCDTHRERWFEYTMERAPVAKFAREEGHAAGRSEAMAEKRQEVEELSSKLRRARTDAWAEAVDAINGEPLVSEEARRAMTPVMGRIAPKQSPCGCAAVFSEGRWMRHSSECPESFALRLERESAVRPFLALARDRLVRMSYEPIQLEACTRLLKAFNAEGAGNG